MFLIRPSFGLSIIIACLLALTPTRAAAQPRDPVAGEALFREGRRLLKAGEIAEACAKLAESQRLDPAAGTLANLAECEERLGRTASAWEHWRRVAEQLPATDGRRATALARSVELEKQLARLAIEVAPGSDAQSMTIERDRVPLGAASLGLALPLDPGPHVVVVSAPGRQPRRYDVIISPGEQKRLLVSPGDAQPAPSATGATSTTTSADVTAHAAHDAGTRVRRWSAYGLLGAGAAGLGAGVVLGLQARQARRDAADRCGSPGPGGAAPLCWSRAHNALARDATYSRLADAGFVGGSLALAVGTYLFFTSSSARRPEIAVTVTPAAGTGAEVQLAGRF